MLDDFREWLSDNLRYILLGLGIVLIVLIIFGVIRLIGGSGRSKEPEVTTSNTSSTAVTASTEAVTEGGTEEDEVQVSSGAPAGSSELVKDDAAILTLVQQYYTGVAEKNIGTLSQIVDPWDETVSQNILGSDAVEAYQNIAVYSKKGLNDGEYVVFAYYEAKLPEIETLVPGLSMLYIKTGDGGKLVVDSARDSEADVTAYMTQVSNDSDVQALISEVDRQYQAALAADEALNSYIASLDTTGADTDNTSDDGQSSSDTDTVSASDVVSGETMMATTTINIRQTASTDAAIMGVLPEGTEITVQSSAENGWVQIEYVTSGGTIYGYVMLEYLTSTGSAAVADSSADAAADTTAEDTTVNVTVDNAEASAAA